MFHFEAVDNVPAIDPPETLIPALNTGIWFIVTTPSEAIAIASVSPAEPILPAFAITTLPVEVNVPPVIFPVVVIAEEPVLIVPKLDVIEPPSNAPTEVIFV